MGDVCKRKTKCPDALVRRRMGYTQPPKQVINLTYGRSNEKKGIKAYIFTFANVFPYMTLTTKLTFNFA